MLWCVPVISPTPPEGSNWEMAVHHNMSDNGAMAIGIIIIPKIMMNTGTVSQLMSSECSLMCSPSENLQHSQVKMKSLKRAKQDEG